MKTITNLVESAGCELIWDLAHSAGALPVELNKQGVRFAVGCTYKYLNGGPGAPGFVYVAKDSQGKGSQPLTGWLGHKHPFAFESQYDPADDIFAFRTGIHSPLAYSTLEASIELWQQVDLIEVREKSLKLSSLFQSCIASSCQINNIIDVTPVLEQRGSHVSLMHRDHGHGIIEALNARGVIGDYREPGLMGFGFAPLYLSYVDVWNTACAFNEVLGGEEYRKNEFQVRLEVT